MTKRSKILKGLLAASCMLAVILDGKTAQSSIQQGLELCLKTVIPALFPFFILSGILNSTLLGSRFSLFRHMGTYCKIPQGSESILAIGLLSGYPVGAQLITQSYRNGHLKAEDAKRLLGFCSNAGPAFIFGIVAPLFENPIVPWVIWGIHITGALIAGHLLPGGEGSSCKIIGGNSCTLSNSLQYAIRSMATVCGWVIVFRLLFGFCDRWFLWYLPNTAQVIFTGILELSNGCLMLGSLPEDGLRFIFAGFMLSFGGGCVFMQTKSVTQELGMGYYFPGKVIQTFITLILSFLLQPILFPPEQTYSIPPTVLSVSILITCLTIWVIRRKKVVAFGGRMLYNTGKHMH